MQLHLTSCHFIYSLPHWCWCVCVCVGWVGVGVCVREAINEMIYVYSYNPLWLSVIVWACVFWLMHVRHNNVMTFNSGFYILNIRQIAPLICDVFPLQSEQVWICVCVCDAVTGAAVTDVVHYLLEIYYWEFFQSVHNVHCHFHAYCR